MEGSIMGGPMLSVGVLELEPSSLHHHHAMASLHQHHQQYPCTHLQALSPLASRQHLNSGHDNDHSVVFDSKGATPKNSLKRKLACTSDEEEPSFTEEGDCLLGGKGRTGSPWHRMKWSDSMVRLLINVVLLVGEDGTCESGLADGCNKRKSGLLQKKGKWRSVSRIMNERGCYVSPQQAEDKFNDLNKRYKRLNDILGKGIACRVVENPNLLDTMENLSSKLKDDVKKILSSKHLFYKEMCAYHTGCKSLVTADCELQPSIQVGGLGKQRQGMGVERPLRGENDMDGEEDEDEDEDEDGEEDDDEDDYEDYSEEIGSHVDVGRTRSLPSPFGKQRKLSRSHPDMLFGAPSNFAKNIGVESLLSNEQLPINFSKPMGGWQHNFKTHVLQLEEHKVNILAQFIELEQRQFRWQRSTCRKDWEIERVRLDNKKMKLENQHFSLQLKQQELEVECKRSETSMTSIDLILERLQTKEALESRGQEQASLE